MRKRLLSLIMTTVLALQPVLCVQAEEQSDITNDKRRIDSVETSEAIELGKRINPVYSTYVKKDSLISISEINRPVFYSEELEFETDPSEIAAQIRNEMIARNEGFSVFYATEKEITTIDDFSAVMDDFLEEALKETTDSRAGDYLRWHWGGLDCTIYTYELTEPDGNHYYEFEFAMTYYTTVEQESKVDTELAKVLEQLGVMDSSLTDYEKTVRVYDYICENVEYDTEHYGDEDYYLQFTAYAALIQKRAVCQGYSTLMYRMLEEAGVDARVIVSIEDEAHAWNLSEIDDVYYYSDATWDADEIEYQYFLLGEQEFDVDHTPDPEYTAFLDDYLISPVYYHEHEVEKIESVEPDCIESGNIEYYTCAICGFNFSDETANNMIEDEEVVLDALGHDYESVVTKPTKEEKGYTTHTCLRCGDTYVDSYVDEITEGFGDADVYRIYGMDRYGTAFEIADCMKAQLGVDKFENIVIVSGTSYADALSGSYFASLKNAPILMASKTNAKELNTYVEKNLKSGGKVYILGGPYAVPESVDKAIEKFDVERVYGMDRYQTNLAVLEAAGVNGEPLMICTGTSFADSLSASAVELPILLVDKTFSKEQREFLNDYLADTIYIIGGKYAVNSTIESELKKDFYVKRIAGATRYDTSVEVAKMFFDSPETAVLTYGMNYPDGLCGGPLAMCKNAPLLLTENSAYKTAMNYTLTEEIYRGAVLGGAMLVSDNSVMNIFGLVSNQQIEIW